MKSKPQFTIRSLLVLTALLAIAIGWLADRQRMKSQLSQAAQRDLQQRQKILAMAREIEQLKPADFNMFHDSYQAARK